MQIARAILAVLAVVALGFFFDDRDDQAIARHLAANGTTSTTTATRVHVRYVSGKGGGYYEVDEVEANVAGLAGPIRLRGLRGPRSDGGILFFAEQEGWQEPTLTSGYASPLAVRYDPRGTTTIDAMAHADLDYWVNSTDAETDLWICGFLAALLLASVVPSAVRAHRARLALVRRLAPVVP